MINSETPQNLSKLTENPLLNWQAAFKLGPDIVGGKAWNLGRLHRYGFNVPEGGVLPTSIYNQFIIENKLSELINKATENITIENIHQSVSKQLIEKIQTAIQRACFSDPLVTKIISTLEAKTLLDKPLAVRSSASAEDSSKASFAGIHDSYLNVNGINEITQAVKACFASVWSLRAVAYRRKMKVNDEDVLPAVIIMELINADAAGVAFSCDPATGREDLCLINANFGLGQSVVNGTVESDTYLIDRYTFKIEKKQIGKKQFTTRMDKKGGTFEQQESSSVQYVLSNTQQQNLGLLVSRIYAALSASDVHQDIEWAIKDGIFYILQARPVTVLPRYTEDVLSNQPDIWSNSNFRDALPMVVPVIQRDGNVYMLNHTILSSFSDIGFQIKPGLSIGKLIQGRLYFNTGLYQRLIYSAVGVLPDDFNLYSGGHQPNIEVPTGSPFAGLKGIGRLLRVLGYSRKIAHEQKNQYKLYARIDNFIDEFKNIDLNSLTDEKFLDLLHSSDQILFNFMSKYMLLSAGIGPFGLAINSLKGSFGDEAVGIVSGLATGQGNQPSSNQIYGLLHLAEIARDDAEACEFLKAKQFTKNDLKKLSASSPFKQAFTKYLNEFGYRAILEADISSPRWNEDPSYLLENIASSMASADVAAHKINQQKIYNKSIAQLKMRTGFFKRLWVKKLVKDAIKGADTRETAKSYSVQLFELTRLLSLQAGQRLHNRNLISEAENIFYCSRADVLSILKGDWEGAELQTLINDRKLESASLMKQDAADVVLDNKSIFQQAKPIDGDNIYQGIGVSAGQIEGIARRINNPAEGLQLNPGEIMIAPSTDPSWTPLFLYAAGIVLETGGYTSHGSIVAREYGIPAVVNVPGALKLINDNQHLYVNGDNGKVILKKT